jgi:DNA-binding MarR family transcriptional regulator
MISLGAEAGERTAAQYRALGVLASRSQWRLADLAASLGVAPSSAGRMCGRLARKGLLRTRRASRDRRAVLVSVTAAGRKVADEAAGRQRALVADILGRLPAPAQRAVAGAFPDLAAAAGEVPGVQWREPAAGGAPVPRPRPERPRPGGPVPQVRPAKARAQERP